MSFVLNIREQMDILYTRLAILKEVLVFIMPLLHSYTNLCLVFYVIQAILI